LVGLHDNLSIFHQIPTEKTNLDIFRGQEEVIGRLRGIGVGIYFSSLYWMLLIFGGLRLLLGDERDRGKRTGRGKEGVGLECSGVDTGPLNFLFPLAGSFAIGLRY
jgi:hypothetical protein